MLRLTTVEKLRLMRAIESHLKLNEKSEVFDLTKIEFDAIRKKIKDSIK